MLANCSGIVGGIKRNGVANKIRINGRIKTELVGGVQRNMHQAKTWVVYGKSNKGNVCGTLLFRLVSSPKMRFLWRGPDINPYLRQEERNTVTSRYSDVVMAVSRH